MGVYLNGTKPFALYKEIMDSPYFVDKSSILTELLSSIDQASKYICITRPRRFGKTVMANMIGAFLSKGKDSRCLFDGLSIVADGKYEENINQYNVIYISFNEVPSNCRTYEQYIGRIQQRLMRDLKRAYPQCGISDTDAVWDVLNDIYEFENETRFIFIFDEWDFIFHRDFVTESDKKEYVLFLSNLLKDKPYVSLAYMTGILPIAKYSSGSELNMFLEYTMTSEERFGQYFGFTENEVDVLYQQYLKNVQDVKVTREGLKDWYDGYHTMAGERLYNPRSVVAALTNNNLGNYWTSSGPYDEIFYYIEKNVAEVRDDLALMTSGEAVSARIHEYAATSANLQTKDEIFSAMCVYGFLSYEDGKVSIPNRELMNQFAVMMRKESSLGYVYRLAQASDRMLDATLAGDTDTMTEILSYAHDTEVPLKNYSDETELSAIVNLVYLSARDKYDIQREDKAGIGYVDFVFYPKNRNDECIILELKINHSPDDAIRQIKDRQYALRFHGKLGEKRIYTGRILAVGISYDKKTKKHMCKIEYLD